MRVQKVYQSIRAAVLIAARQSLKALWLSLGPKSLGAPMLSLGALLAGFAALVNCLGILWASFFWISQGLNKALSTQGVFFIKPTIYTQSVEQLVCKVSTLFDPLNASATCSPSKSQSDWVLSTSSSSLFYEGWGLLFSALLIALLLFMVKGAWWGLIKIKNWSIKNEQKIQKYVLESPQTLAQKMKAKEEAIFLSSILKSHSKDSDPGKKRKGPTPRL